ncbi:hypothetical protein T4D_16101 [Trichinella pseudospiralis]|uniref:Uncharacterized protein n=1 Tax=Trichinella pseudospiralis TaxID=6337 RepID=A0A0V1FLR2_TRIPS|nr:hypothetical protein T4D_4067 [Trichinella pseudospiralis]KRY86985.1 hypothetical protein T4D_16101 [Trichinella pseudospiralis]
MTNHNMLNLKRQLVYDTYLFASLTMKQKIEIVMVKHNLKVMPQAQVVLTQESASVKRCTVSPDLEPAISLASCLELFYDNSKIVTESPESFQPYFCFDHAKKCH